MQAGLVESALRNNLVETEKEVKTVQGHVLGREGEAIVLKSSNNYKVRGTAVKVKEMEVNHA
jgi:hypothetical protein